MKFVLNLEQGEVNQPEAHSEHGLSGVAACTRCRGIMRGRDKDGREWRPIFEEGKKYTLVEILSMLTRCENTPEFPNIRVEVEAAYRQLVELNDYRITMLLSYAALKGMGNVLKGGIGFEFYAGSGETISSIVGAHDRLAGANGLSYSHVREDFRSCKEASRKWCIYNIKK